MQWENVPEKIEDWFGFVYRITCLSNGKKYIGKKQFWSNQKRPPLKGKKRGRRVTKESDWKEYYGSSNDLKADLQKYGKENFKREILELTTCKWENAYLELMWQLKENAVVREDYYNGIINIRLNGPPKDLVDKYRNVKTDSEKEIEERNKCRQDIIYFAEKYIKIKNLDNSLSNLTLFDKQKETLKLWSSNRIHITLNSRQTGISVLHCILVIHDCLFNEKRTNVVMTVNYDMAKNYCFLLTNILNKLVSPVKIEWEIRNFRILFDNNSQILVTTSHENSIKGRSINNLIMDNIDYYPSLEKTERDIIPAITKNDSRLIISGTPVSNSSPLATKYKRGEYSCNKILWNDVANRDDKWKTATQDSLGDDYEKIWEKEYECSNL